MKHFLKISKVSGMVRVQVENAEEAVMLHEESRLLVPDVASREMMYHLRSSLSDDDVVDEVSDDLPVVFRFNQAFDVLEEARAFLVIEAKYNQATFLEMG